MPAKLAEWTPGERARRDRILGAAKVRGITNRQLAKAAGLRGPATDMRISRWAREKARLEEPALAAMEDLVRGGGPEGEDSGAPMAADAVAAALAELSALAGPAAEGDADELRALARAHRRTAFGGLLRLAAGARSETVRLRALEAILERADGKAVQAFLDTTPRPPADASELRERLLTLLVDGPAPTAAPPAPVPEAPPASA